MHKKITICAILFLLLSSIDAISNSFLPIHQAAESGDVASCKILLGAGASVNALGPDGQTPLLLASQNGHLNVVQTTFSCTKYRR